MLFLTFALLVLAAGCNEDTPEVVSDTSYNGIFTRVKLGMPLTRIVSMQREGIQLYYENDLEIWAVDDDIDLMEVKSLISEGHQFYYVENPIMTYKFREVSGDPEVYLNSYSQEVHCIIDRETGNKYYNDKAVMLRDLHKATGVDSQLGTEGIDMTLERTMKYDLPSYNVVFTMIETFMTVEDTEDYYVTDYSIEIIEKAVKDPVSKGEVALE